MKRAVLRHCKGMKDGHLVFQVRPFQKIKKCFLQVSYSLFCLDLFQQTSPQAVDMKRSLSIRVLLLLYPPWLNEFTILVRCQWWIREQCYKFTVLYLVVNDGSTGLCMQGIVFAPGDIPH